MGCGASTGNVEPLVNEDPMAIAKHEERESNLENFKLEDIENYKGTKPSNRKGQMVCVDEVEEKIYVFGGKTIENGENSSSREDLNKRAMYVYHKKKWYEIGESEMSGDIPPMLYDGTLSLVKAFSSEKAYKDYQNRKKNKKKNESKDNAQGTLDGKVVVGGNMAPEHLDEVNPDANEAKEEDEKDMSISSPEYFSTRIALIGGKRSEDNVPSGDIYIFYPATGRWEVVNMISGDWVDDSISGHSAVVYKKSIYVFGGKLDRRDLSRRVFKLNLASNGVKVEKKEVPQFTITKRRHHGATVFGHYMFVIGGETRTGSKFDLWRYDLLSNQWDKMLLPVAELPNSDALDIVNHANSLYIYDGNSSFFARLLLDQDDPQSYKWVTLQIEDENIPVWPSPKLAKLKDDIHVVASNTSPTAAKLSIGKIIIYDTIKARKDNE